MIVSQESTTAKLCSFARAYHSTYVRKKIFDDSLAFDFMGPEQYRETGQLIGHDYRAGRSSRRRPGTPAWASRSPR